MVVEDQYDALGIAHRPAHLFLEDLSGKVAAQVVQEQGIDIGNDDFARRDLLAVTGPSENLFDHVHDGKCYLCPVVVVKRL